MPHRRMTDQGQPLGRSQIAALSTQLDLPFPRSLVTFLLRYNGGRPVPRLIEAPYPGGRVATIMCFLGIRPGHDFDIAAQMARLGWDLPRGAICIASTDTDDQFLLMTRGRQKGRIFIWDWHGRHRNRMSNCYPVAPSLSVFLKRIVSQKEIRKRMATHATRRS